MATTELTANARPGSARRSPRPDRAPHGRARRELTRTIAVGALGLLALTALGALLSWLEPVLAPSMRPHPTLHPTLAAIAAILATNARALAAPFILAAARFDSSRPGRLLGDAVVAAILATNALHIGLAIGRWNTQLFPYIPQLPLEYLAAGATAGAWTDARRRASRSQPQDPRATVSYAALSLLLLTAAAVIEVLATPHAR